MTEARPTRPRAPRRRVDAAAALSGLVWAALAYPLARGPLGDSIWGGMLAAPLIGILVARLVEPFAHRGPQRLFLALASLYLAVSLFGFAAGLAEWMGNVHPERNGPALVVQSLVGCLGGVTLTGLVVVLWPLCLLNHWLLSRLEGRGATRSV